MANEKQVSLFIKFKDGVSKGLNKTKGVIQKFSNGSKKAFGVVSDSFKNTMFSAVALGTAVTGFAMKAIASISQWVSTAKKDFQEFENSLTAVYTLLEEDVFNKHAADLESGAIKIMQEYNLSIEDVNKSLFDSVSAGIEAADATEFLGTAAKLAKGGVTNLSNAVDGMTSILNAYGLEATEATKVADAFFTAQKFGKTTVEQLSNNIGKIAPIAKAAGLSYQELLAATSQLTLSGISTDEAVTALKGSLQAIISPTEDAAKKMAELGIPTGKAAFEGEKFGATMEKIKNSTGANIDVISKLIPNIRGLLAITSVATKEGLQKYDDILQAVKTDHNSLTEALEKQMNVTREQIATERGKLIPLKLKTGKILSIVELGYLRLGNAARETTNIFEQSFGVYGQAVSWLSKLGEKTAVLIGWKKDEAKADAELAESYINNLLEKNTSEREALFEHEEIKKENKISNKEADLEIDQEFLDRQADMQQIAEDARIEFENQKKLFDKMSAADRVKLLIDTLGKERIEKESARINELIEKGKHEEALKKQTALYQATFLEMNKNTLDKTGGWWEKHWLDLLTGQEISAQRRQELEQVTYGIFSDLATLMGEESIEAFRLMQGLAISETLINTYKAAQLAFTSLAGIPFVGPFLGGAAAGLAVTAGLARVAQIKNQKPPQAATGAFAPGDGATVNIGEQGNPEWVLNEPNMRALLNENGGGQRVVNVYLSEETHESFIIDNENKKELMQKEGRL